jgi:hypothetical protein
MTSQPRVRRVRLTSASRRLFRRIFSAQNNELLCVGLPCFGQPCQKQPSTKMATRCFRKTKSGLPNRGSLRRQPVIRAIFSNRKKRNSVLTFSRLRIRAIRADRSVVVKKSTRVDLDCNSNELRKFAMEVCVLTELPLTFSVGIINPVPQARL